MQLREPLKDRIITIALMVFFLLLIIILMRSLYIQ